MPNKIQITLLVYTISNSLEILNETTDFVCSVIFSKNTVVINGDDRLTYNLHSLSILDYKSLSFKKV